MKNVLVNIRHFGKVIALPLFKKILIQNNEFLGHSNYFKRAKIRVKCIHSLSRLD